MGKINLRDLDSSDPRLGMDPKPDPKWWEDTEVEGPSRQGYGHEAILPPSSEGIAQRESIEELFDAALAGFLPRSRELKPWEPDKLNPRHLQIINLRAAGVSNRKISEMLNIGEANVSVVTNHPDAQYILARIIAYAAENVADVEARIRATAPLAHERLVDILTTSKKEESVIKVAFGILDRAGYGAVQKAEVKQTHEVVVAKTEATLISQAIRESQQIQEADYVFVSEDSPPGSPTRGSDGGQADSTDRSSSVSEDANMPPVSGSQDLIEDVA
jgi:transcriptional regulator